MRKFLLFFIVLMALISCKTSRYVDKVSEKITEIEVPMTNTNIEYRDRIVYDSIYFHDSVYTYIKGDTVIQYKEKVCTKYLIKTDTILKIDSIKVPIVVTQTETVTKTVEVNRLYWWQKGLIFIGLAFLITGIWLIIIRIKDAF